jgi:hypothetical protein
MFEIHNIATLPGNYPIGIKGVPILITSGVTTYYRIIGANLEEIQSVEWYPKQPSSLMFSVRQLILVSSSEATFSITVKDNFLDASDRQGVINFLHKDGQSITYTAFTVGPVSASPLWQSPQSGLATG